MKDRIRLIRKGMKLTQAEMGQELGCSQTAYAKYESGMVVPDKPIRMLICEKFNVNQGWLETGEGQPYKEGLIPALVNALRYMPDVQALLEAKLPTLTEEDARNLNDLFCKFFLSGEGK